MNFLIPLVVILLLITVVGGGWCYFIFDYQQSPIFLSAVIFLFSGAITGLSWSWAYGLGGSIKKVNFLIALLSGLGWILAAIQHRNLDFLIRKVKSKRSNIFFVIAAISATFLIGIFPRTDPSGNLTMAIRTGPDAIGASVATEALLRDGTLSDLEKKIIKSSVFESKRNLLKPGSLNVYTIPSVSAQIKAEFILSASRWGFPGTLANILNILGLKYLWVVITLLPALSVLFGTFLIYDCLIKNNISRFFASICSIAGMSNVNFLHVWHEGGTTQAYVYICVAIIFALLLNPAKQMTIFQGSALSLAASIFLFTGHFDMTLLIFAYFVTLVMISLFFRKINFIVKQTQSLFLPFILGLLACGPYFVIELQHFIPRLAELAPGGWQMPIWPNLIEIFGMYNSFNLPYPGTGRATIAILISAFLGTLLAGILIVTIWPLLKYSMTHIFSSIFVIFSLIVIKTIFVDKTTNYQYVKSLGFFAPFLLPVFCLLLKEKLNLFKYHHRILVPICAMVFAASANYALNFRNTSQKISYDLPSKLLDANKTFALDQIDFFGNNTLETTSFSPFFDYRALNSFPGGVQKKIKYHQQIGIFLFLEWDESWKCFDSIDNNRLLKISDKLGILLLNSKSDILYESDFKLSKDYIDTINKLSKKISGPKFDKNMIRIFEPNCP